MAIFGGHPKFRAYDANGQPLNGGLVFTYVAGTSTKKDTFTDTAEGTTNANPVVLDSRGEADIVWDGTYKVILAPSDDTDPPTNPIWTVDNFNPQILDLDEGITDANGNELLRFTIGGSEAVNEFNIVNAVTGSGPELQASGDDTNIDVEIVPKGTGKVDLQGPIQIAGDILDENSNEIINYNATASAVNCLDIINSATGNAVQIASIGDDTNIGLTIDTAGTGELTLGSADTSSIHSVSLLHADTHLKLDGDIQDTNGNEVISHTATANAVNHFTFTNAATTSGVTFSSTGDDTNVAMTIDTKGTGTLTLGSQDMAVNTDADTVDFQTGGSSRLDLNDSGVRLGAANSRVTTILDEDTMSSNSATALATQQSIKAYVDNQSVTAGQADAWINFTGTGTISINDSLNVTSLTDNGTGDYDVNFTTNMANANYCAVPGCWDSGDVITTMIAATATTFVTIRCYDASNTGTVTNDADNVYVTVHGD